MIRQPRAPEEVEAAERRHKDEQIDQVHDGELRRGTRLQQAERHGEQPRIERAPVTIQEMTPGAVRAQPRDVDIRQCIREEFDIERGEPRVPGIERPQEEGGPPEGEPERAQAPVQLPPA